MTRLTKPLDALATIEADHARRTHGPDYASHHEGYGVLAEEVQETADELRTMQRHVEYLLRVVRAGDDNGVRLTLAAIRWVAIAAAAECVQVAAVAEKWISSDVNAVINNNDDNDKEQEDCHE